MGNVPDKIKQALPEGSDFVDDLFKAQPTVTDIARAIYSSYEPNGAMMALHLHRGDKKGLYDAAGFGDCSQVRGVVAGEKYVRRLDSKCKSVEQIFVITNERDIGYLDELQRDLGKDFKQVLLEPGMPELESLGDYFLSFQVSNALAGMAPCFLNFHPDTAWL